MVVILIMTHTHIYIYTVYRLWYVMVVIDDCDRSGGSGGSVSSGGCGGGRRFRSSFWTFFWGDMFVLCVCVFRWKMEVEGSNPLFNSFRVFSYCFERKMHSSIHVKIIVWARVCVCFKSCLAVATKLAAVFDWRVGRAELVQNHDWWVMHLFISFPKGKHVLCVPGSCRFKSSAMSAAIIWLKLPCIFAGFGCGRMLWAKPGAQDIEMVEYATSNVKAKTMIL